MSGVITNFATHFQRTLTFSKQWNQFILDGEMFYHMLAYDRLKLFVFKRQFTIGNIEIEITSHRQHSTNHPANDRRIQDVIWYYL